ncbi:hypothetical protein Tco_1079266 [Tanacetum coccineum]|uniref:Retrovirus-related Pol polyprotein from transposon TNT 1-94 n=1 Tax=Tanacetum coccineum TaxID=301880 RepID=A0ABQ5HRE6_9ASTR
MGLWYPKDSGFELIAYSDADHVGCKDDCKSTSGGLQFLGGKLVSWSSKKQDCTAISTIEVEYVSLSACCAQVIWMRTQLLAYGYKYNQIPMYCNSKSAIAISCNPVQHSKTKHIDIRYHFIKEHVEKGTVEIYFVGTEYQLADLFTKALPKEHFEYLVHRIVIIMAQQQHPADVHPDELCPPNKRYDLMDANMKIDLEHVQCPPESKILMNIIKNHPLRFNITASSSVPWIYMAQFWHTLKEDGSKYWLQFMLDKKELSLTLDDFRTIFHLPQANANNQDRFVPPPSFLDMVPFYKQQLGFIMELKTSSSFKTTGVLQPWQTLCKIQILDNTCHWMGSTAIADNANDGDTKTKIDVPLTQSQPTESTQGMHRTPSAPRSPNPKMDAAESSATKRSTVIRFRIPQQRSKHLTPPAPVPTVNKADEMILQDTLQVSLAEHKSQEEQEARENVELVNKHLASEEIEKMVEEPENVIDDSSIPRNDEQHIIGTRLEPRSDKESPEVEINKEKEVEISNVLIPVNVDKDGEEITDEVYELKRMEKGKIVEESRSTPFPTPIRSPRIHTDLVSLDTEKLQELTGRYGYLFAHLKARFMTRKSYDTLADYLYDVLVESLPTMLDKHIKEQVTKQVPEQVQDQVLVYVAEALILERQKNKEEMEKMIAKAILQDFVPEQQYQLYLSMKDDPQLQQQDIAIWLALQMKFERLQNSAKRQKTSEYEAYVTGESSSGQVNEKEQGSSTPWNQEQEDDYDFWTEPYASDDDEIPMKQVSQDIIEEESQKEILVSPHPRKTTPLVHSCRRDPEALALSLINQDLLYLKKGSSGPEKIVLSLHKFLAIVARRANECIVSITEPDFKNLNKNDIEDMYLLIMNGKERVHDFQLGIESYQQKVNLTAPTITFPGIEKHKMFSIIYEPVHGILYKNSKKEKKVMRHSEIHKFYDATLNRVLEGLKSYNNDVKYGYTQRELNNDEIEYLKLFEEEIKVRLRYHNQMRRWEMYVNGRPLGPRREHPE